MPAASCTAAGSAEDLVIWRLQPEWPKADAAERWPSGMERDKDQI